MTRDELLLRVTRLFAYKRPELLPETVRDDYVGISNEQYRADLLAVAKGSWKFPLLFDRRRMYGAELANAVKLLRSYCIYNPLPRLISEMIDYLLSEGAHRLFGKFRPMEFSPGPPNELRRQLYNALCESFAEFLVPDLRDGEWAKKIIAEGGNPKVDPMEIAGRLEHYEVDQKGSEHAPDSQDSIAAPALPTEREAIERISTREEEIAAANVRVAELLAGYPKFAVDLAYAASSWGRLGAWAEDAGVSYQWARALAVTLRRELQGKAAKRLNWTRLARKYGHGDLSDEPGRSSWEHGSRTDSVTCRTHTGWIHSGEIPSGYPWFEDPAVASCYWSDRKGL